MEPDYENSISAEDDLANVYTRAISGEMGAGGNYGSWDDVAEVVFHILSDDWFRQGPHDGPRPIRSKFTKQELISLAKDAWEVRQKRIKKLKSTSRPLWPKQVRQLPKTT